MSVFHAVTECVQILILAETKKTLSSDLRLELANILVRLKIWAGNVGVFAPDNASVDYRLRDDPDLVEVVFSMTRKLKQSLYNAVHPPLLEESDDEDKEASQRTGRGSICSRSSSATLDLDSSVEESDSDNDLERLGASAVFVEEANNVINRLYRLATVFRKPESSSENAKVRGFINKLKEKSDIEELEDVKDHAWSHINAHFPEAPKFLASRLVEAVIFRRMKIRYRQRHQSKLNQGLESAFAAPSPYDEDKKTSGAGGRVPAHRSAKPDNVGGKSLSRHKTRSVAFSATNASSVNRARIDDYARSTALSRITKAAVSRRQQLDVPPPPDSNGQNKVQCPYCQRMISKDEMGQPRWTRHILKDINPFVCLFEVCEESLTLFKTAEEWLGHMRWQHTVVFSCQAVGHEQELFGSPQELEDHIRGEHPDTFTESQLPGLVQQGALPTPDTFGALNSSLSLSESCCVLCNNLVSQSVDTETTDDAALDSSPEQRIHSHILEHLEAIALLALPDSGDADGADSEARKSSPGPDDEKKKERDDLPPAIFEDTPTGRAVDESVPDQDGHDDCWAAVFQQVKQSRLLKPHEDPVLIKIEEGKKEIFSPLFPNFHSWVDTNQVVGTDGLGNDAKYIPVDALVQYWTDDRVSSILNSCSHDTPIHVSIDEILTRYLRIFSILVYISTDHGAKLHYMERFMEKDIDDQLLPFKAQPNAFPNAADGTYTFGQFQEDQWLFSPAALGPNRLQSRELLPRSVLPFTVEQVLSGRPGEGKTVKKCNVHPSCGLPISAIVLKEFDSSETDFWFRNEVDSYIILENEVPPAVYGQQFLKHYGSFKKADKAFIMLEYADQGSLSDFFNRDELPQDGHELYDLWLSLSNLFIGLEYIHSLEQGLRNTDSGTIRCVHQDLKPANIFVFRNGDSSDYRYQFKIGEFGMSSIALVKTRNKSNESPDNVSTKMYGAPELIHHYPGSDGLDYGAQWDIDIWSMGCVLFEALVWMTCGSRGLSEFFQMRQRETDSVPRHAAQGYSGCFHNGTTRIQAVDNMKDLVMQRRRVFDNLSGPIGDLILKEMLRPSQTSRLEAKTLLHRFGDILATVNQQPDNSEASEPRPVSLIAQGVGSWQGGMGKEESGDHGLEDNDLERRHTFGRETHNYERESKGPHASGSFIRSRNSSRVANESRSNFHAKPTLAGSISPASIQSSDREQSRLSWGSATDDPHKISQSPENYESIAVFPMEDLEHKPDRTSESNYQPTTEESLPSNDRLPGGKVSYGSSNVASGSNVNGPKPYARVTISQVLDWIDAKKKGWGPQPLPDHERAIREINDREQIFVVDDSDTMRKHHWGRVVETLQALGYLVKHADPDGVELFFTSRPTKPKKSGGKEISSLVRSLEEHGRTRPDGPCNMESSLGPVLEHVKSGLTEGSWFRQQTNRRGTNVYILTDAIWEGGAKVQCGVEQPIKDLWRTMQALGKTRATVALQFIQFGDDALGEERLRYLDDTLGKQLDFDIVDHRHHERDGVWDMLVGSISRDLDEDAVVVPIFGGGRYTAAFKGNWYCCLCRANDRLLSNPNSSNSITCEDRSCGHRRCGNCKKD